MSKGAEYLIAQYTADPFRREPRNVGVVVKKDGKIAARFLGEVGAGDIDGRKVRSLRFPNVYRQWVDHWRSVLADPSSAFPALLDANGANYRMLEGGEVTDVGVDPLDDVAGYLFSLLVSEGGFAEAIAEDSAAGVGVPGGGKLQDEVRDTFNSLSILAEAEGENLFAAHPIKRGVGVRGNKVRQHRPDFVQENGRLYVMETVDFDTTRTAPQSEHAGRTAYMFADLMVAHENRADAISIIRLPSDRPPGEDENIMYGLAMLEAESRVVSWSNQEQREEFLEERKALAME